MRVIATLTTIPSRIDHIRATLDSVLAQTISVDHIELNVPEWCLRTNEPYVLPAWLDEMPKVHVIRTPDYGAITKIAPTLLRHRDEPDTMLWSVDDDFVYPANTLAWLWKDFFPDQGFILCNSGCVFSNTLPGITYQTIRTHARVDLLEGFGTVLYPTTCIGDDFADYVETTSKHDDARKSDDVILSNYFARRGTSVWTSGDPAGTIQYHKHMCSYYNKPDALHKQDDGHQVRYGRVLRWLKEQGLYGFSHTPPPVPVRPVLTRQKRIPPGHGRATAYFRQVRGNVLSGVDKDDDRVVDLPTLLRG